MLKINGFSENKLLIATEDYDAWLRLAKLEINFFRINNALGYYSVSIDNLSGSSKTIVFIKELMRIYFPKRMFGYLFLPVWMNLSLALSRLNNRNYCKATFHLFLGFMKKPHEVFRKIICKYI